MTYAIGQTITHVITLRDDSNVAITGLLEEDFVILEAYSVNVPATTELVALEEINQGQYSVEFTPESSGPWAFHYVYDDPPVFREETFVYSVAPTAEIVVVTAGGTWTYSGDLEDPSQLVRFLIQDTDGDHPLFTDAEVAYALGASASNSRKAAISLVERLMARYAAMADTTELDLSVRASQLYDHYKDLLATLKMNFGGNDSAQPYAGGISKADILSRRQNTDRVFSVFDRTRPYPPYGRIY